MTAGVFTFDRENHKYFLDGVRIRSITEVFHALGLIDTAWMTEYGRQRGTGVHEATALLDKGKLDRMSVDPRIEGFVTSWENFKDEFQFKPELIEVPLVNRDYRYAGTPDREGILRDDRAIIEIKTGEVDDVTALQTAGQDVLMPMVAQARRRFAVKLNEDGTFRVKEFTDFRDRLTFLSGVSILNWGISHSRYQNLI